MCEAIDQTPKVDPELPFLESFSEALDLFVIQLLPLGASSLGLFPF